MSKLFKFKGFPQYISIVFLNAMTDLGHKIVLQNTVFKTYSGSELIILTAIINALILLPFILFFSPAGFLSDRYPKTKIIKYASAIAVLITIFITLSYLFGWFWVAFFLTLLLSTQSAIYSPAKYGLIKEMVGSKQITEANAIVQSVTIISILAGALIYSILFEILIDSNLDTSSILKSIYPLGFLLVGASIFEFLLSIYLDRTLKGISEKRDILKTDLKETIALIRRYDIVWLSIIGLSLFWGLSQLIVAIFGDYLKQTLGVENTVIAQGLLSISGIGIIFGSIFVGKVSKNHIETGVIPIGVFGIFLTLLLIHFSNSLISIGLLLFLYGLFSGLFIVPLNSLIQFATPNSVLGKVLAGNNLIQNISMFLFLILSATFAYFGLNSGSLLSLAVVVALLGFIYTLIKLPNSFARFIVSTLFRVRYRLYISGIDNLKINRPTLLVGNHISFLDWAIVQIAYPKQIRFVIHRGYYNLWYLKPIFKLFGAIPISSAGSKGAIRAISEALNRGDSVALFPEGRISRSGNLGEFNRGFEIAVADVKRRSATIIPFYIRGIYSYALSKEKKREIKDISISFGEPMPINSTAKEVRERVLDLSIDSFMEYLDRTPTVAEACFIRAKQIGSRAYIADSTKLELNGYRFLTSVITLQSILKSRSIEGEIGLLLPTSVVGAVVNIVIFSMGKRVINLNYTSSIDSLKFAVNLADIDTIITSRLFISKLKTKGFNLEPLLNGLSVIYLEDIKGEIGNFKKILNYLIVRFFPTPILTKLYIEHVLPSDTAVIMFSSGSEGRPKGIELTHSNIMGNIKQIAPLFGATKHDVILGTLPIFHSFGLTVTTLFPLIEGVFLVAHSDPTDGFNIAKLCLKYRATIMFGTPTFFRLYAKNRKIHPLMFESLRLVIAGAERLPKETVELFKSRFLKEILQGYGTTETSPVASCNLPDRIDPDDLYIQKGNRGGSVGVPILGTKFIVVEPKSLKVLDREQEGMLLISGVQVMKGYLKNSSQDVIKEINGKRYYMTGDKGYIDRDGFVYIVDRYSRFAKIGGEMISLGAVEEKISKLIDTAVTQIAVTAIRDIKKGERLVLLLEGEMEIDALKREIKESKLHPLYTPTLYFKVKEIPKLGTGKSDFKRIKQMAIELSLK